MGSDKIRQFSPSVPLRQTEVSIADSCNTRLFNLTFHGLGVPGSNVPIDQRQYWLGAAVFERVLDRVVDWPDAAITFDDGNLSDLTVAFPVLVRRQLCASFFVVAGRIGLNGYLGRSELHELVAAGMEIGSHGMHHRSWRGLDDGALREETVVAKARLEDMLGIPVTQAACPFGGYDRRALEQLATSGFTRVYTSDRGWARSDAWLQPRNTVTSRTRLQDLEQVRSWSWPKRLAHNARVKLKCFR
jgi:peptidoglycan/xylan/chitin deacetylase (PgdA/CDA1 family)